MVMVSFIVESGVCSKSSVHFNKQLQKTHHIKLPVSVVGAVKL